ncbi:MAG: hypothetical protein IJ420_02885 [Lachnospiraceae bacterium]|nr:hypothetical protein [Lachnospiraceae bacterium]
MIKSLQSVIMIASMVSISLFGGKNIGLTKEIDNLRECVVCSVETRRDNGSGLASAEGGMALGYTDGFWVEEDETAYLLDTYGNRVLEFSGENSREILLSDTVLPSDIVTCGEKIYIFDDLLKELQIYTKQGELLVRSQVQLENDYVKQLSCINGAVMLQTYQQRWYSVNSETGDIVLNEHKQTPAVAVGNYSYAEYLETDEDGTVYSVHTSLVKNCPVISGELTLRAVSAEGELVGSYILPVMEYTYLPDRYLQVHQNGNIYIMIPSEETVEIRKISLKSSTESVMTELTNDAKNLAIDYAANTKTRKGNGKACTEAIVFSREEAKQRAYDMAFCEWTLKKTHTNTSKAEKGVVLPREIAFQKKMHANESSWSETMTGLPYCWGGFYALDTGVGGKTFDSMMKKWDAVAGNINPTGYLKYLTIGVDCSGYAGAVFGFSKKYNTSAISDIGTGVTDVKELQQMDIFVYPGEHVILFSEWVDDATALVCEAAIREGKVEVHPKSINEFVISRKYQMRSPW